MRSDTGPAAGRARAARRKTWVGAIAGTALAATALTVYTPAPEHALAATTPPGTLMYVSGFTESSNSSALNTVITAYDLDDSSTAVATIPTASPVDALAFSPDATTVYATEDDGHLDVVSVATNTITARIALGGDPAGVAVSPNGATVYVTSFGADDVYAVNTSTDTVTATIPVGVDPEGIAFSPDGATAYVADQGDGAVSVISTATDTVTGTISIGGGAQPTSIAVTPNGERAYVTGYHSDTVSVIDTATGTVIDTIPVGVCPWGLAITPDGGAVYVANAFGGGYVSAISTATNTVTATISVGGEPTDVAAYPDGGSVYVTTEESTLPEIATESNTVTGVYSGIPNGFAVALSPEPRVDSVSPASGPAAGGNRVTLTGVGFNNVLAVSFGGAPATSYTVTSPTTIVATVPPGRSGPVYVFVTTDRGGSGTNPGSQYSYLGAPPGTPSPSPTGSARAGTGSPSPSPSTSFSPSPSRDASAP